MAFNITGIIEPVVLGTAGPTYATNQNTAITAIDNHDHSTGKGLQITPSGININANLSYTGFGPINMSWASLSPKTLPTVGVHPTSLLSDASGNLYYENNSGVQIQLTSGSSVQSNGTGTLTGFYNFGGGTGYSTTPVQAGYANDVLQYRFTNTNADFPSTTAANASTVAIGALYIAANQDPAIVVGSNACGGAFTGWHSNAPTGGWALGTQAALTNTAYTFTIGMDSAHNGVYTTWIPLRLAPLGTSDVGVAFAAGLAINWGKLGKDSNALGIGDVPLHIGSGAYQPAGTPVTITRFAGYTEGAIPVAGDGIRSLYQSAWQSGETNGYTVRNLAAISAVWGASVGVNGGLTISGAASGTLTATPGFQLMNLAGTDYVGIGGAASASYALGVTGTFNVTGAFTAAGTGSFGGQLTVSSGGVAVTGNSTYANNLAVSGVTNILTLNGTVLSGTTLLAATVATAATVSTGGYFKTNQVLAWGAFDSSGNNIAGNFGMNTVATVVNTSHWTITLDTALTSTTTVAVIGTCIAGTDESGAWVIQAQVTAANTVQVVTYKNNVRTAIAFNIVIIGRP